MSKVTKSIDIYGIHCRSCEAAIEEELKSLNGVFSVNANHNKANVIITYENEILSEDEIKKSIKKSGYSAKENSLNQLFSLGLIVAIMLFLSNNSLLGFDTSALLSNASLFIVGVLSSFHCIGMCGGIMLTQTLDKDNLASLKYNLGRVVSYTLLGGIIGAIGSTFSISMKMQGFIQLIAALFMIIAGLNMFGVKLFKNISINIPFKKKSCGKVNKNPFVVGVIRQFI